MTADSPVPADMVREVESYVTDELAAAEQYDNRNPLDESGVWSLHRMVARVYARGFNDGSIVEAERAHGQARRDRAAGGAM